MLRCVFGVIIFSSHAQSILSTHLNMCAFQSHPLVKAYVYVALHTAYGTLHTAHCIRHIAYCTLHAPTQLLKPHLHICKANPLTIQSQLSLSNNIKAGYCTERIRRSLRRNNESTERHSILDAEDALCSIQCIVHLKSANDSPTYT